MRPLLLIAAVAAAGLAARYVSGQAAQLPKGLKLRGDQGADDRAIGLVAEKGSPNDAERLQARGLGAAPFPMAATAEERGSIPGLPDFTRGA